MDQLDEWCFEFVITAAKWILRAEADELLTEAIEWAVEHRLGVGGGYKPSTAEVDNAAVSWAFRFGLCAIEGNQLIPHASADDLWKLLSIQCQRWGFAYTGGFRPFTQEELDGQT